MGDSEMFGAGPAATSTEEQADRYSKRFPGGGIANVRRLRELFAENSDPGIIEIYKAWTATSEFDDLDGKKAKVSNSAAVTDFDPVEDNAPSSDKLRVKEVYEKASDAGLEDEAAFLRALPFDHQRSFAEQLLDEMEVENLGDGSE